jgi:hypothetical protein
MAAATTQKSPIDRRSATLPAWKALSRARVGLVSETLGEAVRWQVE